MIAGALGLISKLIEIDYDDFPCARRFSRKLRKNSFSHLVAHAFGSAGRIAGLSGFPPRDDGSAFGFHTHSI